MKHRIPIKNTEIRTNPDGSVDEVVGFGFLHIEQMDSNHWWIGFDTPEGRLLHINFHSKGKISIRVEDEGPSSVWHDSV